MLELCRLTQTKKVFTTSFHPMCDGLTERLNQSLIQTLSFLVSESQKDWDQFLDIALLAYRSAKHTTIKMSPARMLYGRELRLPVDALFLQADDPETTEPENGSFEFTEKMKKKEQTKDQALKAVQEEKHRLWDQMQENKMRLMSLDRQKRAAL